MLRLTIAAFVFIPMNFATSFFGMNMKQLKNDIELGYFFLLAGISCLVAWIIAATVKRCQEFARTAHRNYRLGKLGPQDPGDPRFHVPFSRILVKMFRKRYFGATGHCENEYWKRLKKIKLRWTREKWEVAERKNCSRDDVRWYESLKSIWIG
jgi:hypothetical protein